MEKCDKHDKDIMEIRTEFGNFKKEVSEKLDELFEEVRKPILSDRQMFSLILSIIVYLIFTVNYISGNNYRSIKNENTLEKVNIKNDKMYDILITIKEDVATIKGKSEK
jgi:hypothetical protein